MEFAVKLTTPCLCEGVNDAGTLATKQRRDSKARETGLIRIDRVVARIARIVCRALAVLKDDAIRRVPATVEVGQTRCWAGRKRNNRRRIDPCDWLLRSPADGTPEEEEQEAMRAPWLAMRHLNYYCRRL